MTPLSEQAWAAPAIALLIAALGVAGLVIGRRPKGRAARVAITLPSVLVFLIGLLLLVGAVAARVHWARWQASHPAPGKLVDVGGFKLHVWCEGPTRADQPTVLWISGGYGQGLWVKHLQEGIKKDHRSCLIDRAGTGWSDAAPTPRRVQTMVKEFRLALDGAGERAPLVIVGHSLGGLLAANFAALEPQRVKGIVVLDGTPQAMLPEAVQYWMGSPEPSTFRAWAVQFGVTTLLPALNPLNTPAWLERREALRPWVAELAQLEERPSALNAGSTAGYWAMSEAHGVIRSPGSLGDLPVLSIIQPQDADDPKVLEASKRWMRIETPFEERNWRALMKTSQREYAQFSSRSTLKTSPAGTTHDFPVERPDFVLSEVRAFLAALNP